MTTERAAGTDPDPEVVACMRRLGIVADCDTPVFEALTGGVSSQIWKVTAGERVLCLKRALPKLKVEADWFAPVERNAFEVAWYEIANGAVHGAAPRVLAHDATAMLFVMEFLPPDKFRLWKNDLHAGRTDLRQATLAGQRLGRIHAHAARSDAVRARFPRTDIFTAIRLEPYLEATADRHPDLREQLLELSHRTAATLPTVIHGDVSPKNIMLGDDGPVFLDAECASIGDPAFDLAFCLNHFLLKCLWTPHASDGFMASFHRITQSYLREVDWEDAAGLEGRAASLLPGLLLARVDGKSPVEYIVDDEHKSKVRRCARSLLVRSPVRLATVADAWTEELSR